MATLNARQLHNETSAVLDDVAKGKSFLIERHGQIVGELRPVAADSNAWDEIMADVWAAHNKARGATPNPVLAERERKRR